MPIWSSIEKEKRSYLQTISFYERKVQKVRNGCSWKQTANSYRIRMRAVIGIRNVIIIASWGDSLGLILASRRRKLDWTALALLAFGSFPTNQSVMQNNVHPAGGTAVQIEPPRVLETARVVLLDRSAKRSKTAALWRCVRCHRPSVRSKKVNWQRWQTRQTLEIVMQSLGRTEEQDRSGTVNGWNVGPIAFRWDIDRNARRSGLSAQGSNRPKEPKWSRPKPI